MSVLLHHCVLQNQLETKANLTDVPKKKTKKKKKKKRKTRPNPMVFDNKPTGRQPITNVDGEYAFVTHFDPSSDSSDEDTPSPYPSPFDNPLSIQNY